MDIQSFTDKFNSLSGASVDAQNELRSKRHRPLDYDKEWTTDRTKPFYDAGYSPESLIELIEQQNMSEARCELGGVH